MSDEEKKKSLLPAPLQALADLVFKREAALYLGLLFIGAGGFSLAQDQGQRTVKDAVDAGMAAHLREYTQHVKDEDARILVVEQQMHKMQQDSVTKEQADAARFNLMLNALLTGSADKGDARRLSQPSIEMDGGAK